MDHHMDHIILWVTELLKSNQTRYTVSHGYLDCRTKRFIGLSCLGKNVRFSYGNLWISQIMNFENRSFSNSQQVVRIKPNSAWSIPWVSRVQNKKNFCYSLSRKKVRFSYGNLRISRLANFKNRSSFIGSWSCSKWTKLGMEYNIGT